MIKISCTNCKTVLTIDDAFAGGVCRCQHCGTIQTVPARGRETVAVGSPSASGTKSLYQSGAVPSGTGLDELAGAVMSSGLSSSRLTKPVKTGKSTGKATGQNMMPLVIAATVIVALLVVIIVILVSRSGSSTNANGSGATGTGVTPNAQATGSALPNSNSAVPTFCSVPLQGTTIIYLLDCGSSSKDYLGDLKDATIKSLGSLGSDRKFQILFWNNGSDGAFPENSTTYASKENIDSAQKTIDDVPPFGQSDIKAALKLAIAQHPDTLIIATGKGFDLDNAWLDTAMSIRGNSPVKIHTFNLGSNGESAPLKKLATQTGGTYHELTQADLRTFSQ